MNAEVKTLPQWGAPWGVRQATPEEEAAMIARMPGATAITPGGITPPPVIGDKHQLRHDEVRNSVTGEYWERYPFISGNDKVALSTQTALLLPVSDRQAARLAAIQQLRKKTTP